MIKKIFKISFSIIILGIAILYKVQNVQAVDVPHYWVGGSASWNGTAGSKWAATSGGVGVLGEPTASDTVYFDNNSGAVTVTVATSTRPCLNLYFNGDGTSTKFTGTFAGSVGVQPSGSVVLASGITWTYTGTINMIGTGSQTFTSNGLSIASALVQNGTGGTLTFADNYTSTGRLTLTDGTVTLNGKSVSTGGFTSTANANNKTFTIAGGTLTITGTGTWVTSGTQTNLVLNTSNENIVMSGSAADMRTLNSQSIGANVNFSGSGTATFGLGNGVWGNITVSGATITTFIVTTNVQFNSLSFVGFTGDWQGTTAFRIAGDLTLGSGMTISNSGTITNNLNGTMNITCNTRTMTFQMSVSGGASAILNIQDDCAIDSTHTLQLFGTSGGTFNGNNHNLSVGVMQSANSNTRTFNLGTGTYTLTGTGTVWGFGTSTNLTMNGSSATIKITDTSATAVTFAGGAKTYGTLWFARGASTGDIAVNQSNTFSTLLKDTGTAGHNILFASSATTTVGDFICTGSAGNLITINTNGASATHAFVKTGGGRIDCDYLSLQHSVATPEYTWYAGLNSTNNQATSSAGSGWIFTTSKMGIGSFFFGLGM